MTDWTEKHRPETLREVRGNDKARDRFQEWGETWTEHREPALLYGRPGVGKTSAAHALANDMGWETVELNASDDRTADVIDRVAGEATRSASVTAFGGGADDADPTPQLVILDEADNFHGTVDRGGTRAAADVVAEASQPLVLIANAEWELPDGLRDVAREIEFRDVSARSIVPALRDICRREGIAFDEAALERIADATDGDLRSAVNDLQAIAEGEDRLTVDDVVTGERDRETEIYPFLDAVLKEDTPREALRTAYDVDETPRDLVQWVEDKVPMVYEADELAAAYEHLSNADRWLGRVRSTQDYSFWRYATDAVAAGVASARRRDRGGWTRYGGPPYRSRSSDSLDDVARKVATAAGVTTTVAKRDLLPHLAAMTHHCKPRGLTVRMAAAYDLDAAEVAAVTGSGASTNKVTEIVADAEERRAERAAEAAGVPFGDATAPPAETDEPAATDGTDGPDDGGDTDPGAGDDTARAAEDQQSLGDFA